MEVSSGEEYYIASDNTGTPLAVFSSNGQMIKQVRSEGTCSLFLSSSDLYLFRVMCGDVVSSSSHQ